MKYLRRFSLCAPVLFLLAGALPTLAGDRGDGGRHSGDESLFSAAEYLDHVTYLASDELEGRGTGQAGIDAAADYIASIFEAYGVEPAGDNGTYYQEFPLKIGNRIADDTRLAIGTKGRRTRRPARLREDYVPFPFSETGPFKGEVVFAGYGIVNEDLDYNDYEDLDVTDKVVLLLRKTPDFAEFRGRQDASFRGKASRANAREAAAVLIVNQVNEDGGDELYSFEGGPGGYFGFGRRSFGIPMLHISRQTAEEMLAAAGMPGLAALQEDIEDTQAPISGELEGVSVRGYVDVQPVESPARNVVGLIPGTGNNAEEIIVLGAHYDHLGVRNKSEDSFDPEEDIHNGADDNASGTAMIMTMAKAYTQGPRPSRSLLLIAFTAEEKGLIGSRHFVNNPTVDLDQCVAMINFDMVGRLRDDRLQAIGIQTGDFEEMVERLAEPYDLKIKGGNLMGGGSDHASFISKDIPAMFFFTGMHPQYHQATDDTHLINADGAMRIAKLAADCIDEIDEMEQPPEFHEQERRSIFSWRGNEDKEDKDEEPSPTPRRVRLGVALVPGAEAGVRVNAVMDGSAAARAGIREGDLIIKLGDKDVGTFQDIGDALAGFKDGDKTTVRVERDGDEVDLKVSFGPAADRKPKTDEAKVAASEKRVRLGVALAPDDQPGVRVARIIADTPAARAGIRQDDRIVGLGGATIDTYQDLGDALGEFEDGDKTIVKVERDGEEVALKVRFGPAADRRPKKKRAAAAAAGKRVRLGIRPESDGRPGVLIGSVSPDSPAARAGLEKGDRIVKMGKADIDSTQDMRACLGKLRNGDQTTVAVVRDGHGVTLDVRFGKPRQATAPPAADDTIQVRLARLSKLVDSQPPDANFAVKISSGDSWLEFAMTGRKWSKMLSPDGEGLEPLLEILNRTVTFGDGGPITVTTRSQSELDATDAGPSKVKAEKKARQKRKAKAKAKTKGKSKAERKPKSKKKAKAGKTNPHGGAGDEIGMPTMPPVRLGIMPAYGESEGPGYEISGVVKDGPAQQAGMQKSDRIYKIGKHKIVSVYDYMEALRSYEPGDQVSVIVIRDGKKVALSVKAAAPKSREAA